MDEFMTSGKKNMETNKNSEFIKTNLKWVVGIAFAIIMLYLNSLYVTKEDAAKHNKELESIKEMVMLNGINTANNTKILDEITEIKIKE